MGSEKQPSDDGNDKQGAQAEKADDPDWASGLKQLYDAVVEEELPDTFKNLLARLDDPGSDKNAGSDDGSPA